MISEYFGIVFLIFLSCNWNFASILIFQKPERSIITSSTDA